MAGICIPQELLLHWTTTCLLNSTSDWCLRYLTISACSILQANQYAVTENEHMPEQDRVDDSACLFLSDVPRNATEDVLELVFSQYRNDKDPQSFKVQVLHPKHSHNCPLPLVLNKSTIDRVLPKSPLQKSVSQIGNAGNKSLQSFGIST